MSRGSCPRKYLTFPLPAAVTAWQTSATVELAVSRGIFQMKLLSAFRAALAGAVLVACGAASAADVTFVMKNSHPNALRVQLYSQDREYSWPGNGEDYYLDDGESQTMSLACEEGENICYGAWIDGDEDTYWGTGPSNKQDCETCCYVCEGGETEEINLVP